MGFFSTNKYSTKEHYLSSKEIKRLVTTTSVKSLNRREENVVEELLITRRGADGKISMSQINEVLLKLKNQNKISKYDKDALIQIFKDYFDYKLKI